MIEIIVFDINRELFSILKTLRKNEVPTKDWSGTFSIESCIIKASIDF